MKKVVNKIFILLLISTIFVGCSITPNEQSLQVNRIEEEDFNNTLLNYNKDVVEKMRKDIAWISDDSKTFLRNADLLIEGKLCIGTSVEDTPEYDITKVNELDWNMQVGSLPNTYQLYLQALNPVVFLTTAYEMTQEIKYLDLAYEFINSWTLYEANKKLTTHNVYVWDSHAMAMRTENLAVFMLTALKSDYLNANQIKKMNELLKKHEQYLTDEEYYHENHNHGTMQDRALMVLAICFNNESLMNVAKERLQKQWDFEFTKEMVSTENSFGYHVLNKNIYTDIANYLEANNDDWGREKLLLLNQAQDFMGWMIKPNGNSSAYGESSVSSYDTPTGNSNTVLAYASSKGEIGQKPNQNSIVYPEAGYYIGREYWDEGDMYADSTWTMFKSGFLSVVHKQDDDNSFELYSKGHDIFVDPGFFGYVSNDLRAYLTSASGHNAVSVDGKTYYAKKQNPGNVGIIYNNLDDQEEYDYLIGYNNLYKNIELKRHFIYFKEAILLYDEAKAEDEHEYTQNFQCGPDIRVVEESDTEVLLKIADTGYFVRVKQLNNNTTCVVLKGKEGAEYGQYSPEAGKVEYIHTIRFTSHTKELSLATLITIEDSQGNNVDFKSYEWNELNKQFKYTQVQGKENTISIK